MGGGVDEGGGVGLRNGWRGGRGGLSSCAVEYKMICRARGSRAGGGVVLRNGCKGGV
jgi:hypothetical protein